MRRGVSESVCSREAEFRISRPYDELSALRGESPPGAGDFLRQRLLKFEEYFGVKTHDDLQVSLEILNPAETAALIRVFVEALWNVAKHSGACNWSLVGWARCLSSAFETTATASKPENRRKAPGFSTCAGEVLADLDVISTQ